MSASLLAAKNELMRRLRKEIARAESGTVAVGGLVKAGVALEELLQAGVRELCESRGEDFDEVMPAKKRGISAHISVLTTTSTERVSDIATRALIRSLARACCEPRSPVKAMVGLRNRAAHPGPSPLGDAGPVLLELLKWLESIPTR